MLNFKIILFTILALSINVFASLSVSPAPISGQISLSTLHSTQSITVLNTGSSDEVMNLSLAPITDNTNGFSILTNRCQGKTLKKNQSCYFLVSFNKFSLAANSSRDVQIKNGSSNLVVVSGINSVVLTPASYSTSLSSINFGSFPDNIRSSSPHTITITNNGQLKGTPIIELPSGVSMILNRCNSGIEPGKTCQVSFAFKSLLSLIPQSGNTYTGSILIKKDISDASPLSVSISAILSTHCNTGFEFSSLLNSCVDVRPQLAESFISFTNPTAFPAVSFPQQLGIFTPTMNAGMDIYLFKKDPKGGTLTYQVETGPSLGSLTTLNRVDQAGLVSTFPTASEYFYFPSNTVFKSGNPFFRLFFPYDAAAGTKNIYIKITATSSVSGFSNSIVFHSAYQNDLKFPYITSEVSGNTSQTTIRAVQPTIGNNNANSTVSGYRDILYIDPAKDLMKFKINVPDSNVVNSYASNNNSKIQIVISEANPATGNAIFDSKLYAFYEYDSATELLTRKNSLDEAQSMNCVLGPDVGEPEGAICTLSKPGLANEMAGKVLQVRVRIFSPETLMVRGMVYNYLAVKSISGTPCASAADPVASPYHGLKVVDLNGDGKIAATDTFLQICTAQELRSTSYTFLPSPVGFQRRFANYSLESDIDMAPYYAGGGYKFMIREFQNIFRGNNHKISNFIVDVNDNTKNNANVGTNESTIGPNIPVGAGTYTGTNSQSQLGVVQRVFGASISDLIIENPKIMGNGWTSVGAFSGMLYGYGVMSPNGRIDIATLTSDNNSTAITYNRLFNVHVRSTGNDVDSRPLARVKGSSNVGGLTGNLTGDSVSNVVIVPFSVIKSSVSGVYLDSDGPFTQGVITMGGITGTSKSSVLNGISVENLHVRERSGGGTASTWIGGIVGYNHVSSLTNIFVNGIIIDSNNNMNISVGGLIGTEEDKSTFGSPNIYYTGFTTISKAFVMFDAGNSVWTVSGNSLNVGGLVAGMRNTNLSDSVSAIGDLNVASMVSSFTGFVSAGTIASFVDSSGPNPTTVNNVEVGYQDPGPLYMNRCGSTNPICDSNPELIPANYFTGYFFTVGPTGSPAVQSWDFVNIWRAPQGIEIPDIPYLR